MLWERIAEVLPHFVFVFVFFLVFVSVFVFLFVFFSLALLGVNFVVNALLFATKTTKISFLTFFFCLRSPRGRLVTSLMPQLKGQIRKRKNWYFFSFVVLRLPKTKRHHSKWDLGKAFSFEVFTEKRKIKVWTFPNVSEMLARWTGGNGYELTNFHVTQPWTSSGSVNESDCASSFYSYFCKSFARLRMTQTTDIAC